MLVVTSRFGEFEVEEARVINFPFGLPGFEKEKQFVMIQPQPNNAFYFLQSVLSPELAFMVVPPRLFFQDYELHVAADMLDFLEVNREEDMEVYVILSVPDDFRMTTANLLAPILINPRLRRGVQSIPPESPYKTRHFIFPREAEALAQAR